MHLALISQLEAVGDMAEWTVYVALHLPDWPGEEGAWQGLREGLVRALLLRHCPEWSASPRQAAFLRDPLAVPATWLAQAQAQWAHYRRLPAGEPPGLLVPPAAYLP